MKLDERLQRLLQFEKLLVQHIETAQQAVEERLVLRICTLQLHFPIGELTNGLFESPHVSRRYRESRVASCREGAVGTELAGLPFTRGDRRGAAAPRGEC